MKPFGRGHRRQHRWACRRRGRLRGGRGDLPGSGGALASGAHYPATGHPGGAWYPVTPPRCSRSARLAHRLIAVRRRARYATGRFKCRADSNADGSRGAVASFDRCQPTYATRLWATSSAGVCGCAGSWSTVASWPSSRS